MTEPFETPKVARGAIYFAGEKIGNTLMGLAFAAAIARILTQAELGVFSLLTFATTIFSTITYLSIHVASTKFISEAVGRQDYTEVARAARGGRRLLLVVTFPTLIIGILALPWLNKLGLGSEEYVLAIALSFVSASILNLANLFSGEMLGLGMFSKVVAVGLIHGTSSRLLGIVLVLTGFGVLGLVWGWVLAAAIIIPVSLWFLRGRFRGGGRMSSLTILSFSVPLFLAGIIDLIRNWIDITMLWALTRSLETTGGYFLVVSGVAVISFVWVAIGRVTMPLISASYARSGTAGLIEPMRVSTRLLNILVIPLGVSLAAVSPTAIETIYGAAYLSGSLTLSILAATSILPAYSALEMNIMQGLGYTKHLITIGAVGILVDFVTIVLLIGSLGSVAGALARVFLWSATVVMGYLVLRPKVKLFLREGLLRSVVFSIAIGSSLALVDQSLYVYLQQPIALRILFDLIVFIGVGIIVGRGLRVFIREDFVLLAQAFPAGTNRVVNLASKLLVRK